MLRFNRSEGPTACRCVRRNVQELISRNVYLVPIESLLFSGVTSKDILRKPEPNMTQYYL